MTRATTIVSTTTRPPATTPAASLLESTLAKVKAIDASKLSPGDRVTRSALIEECESGLAQGSCKMWEWVVDPLGGPQVDFVNLVDYTRIDAPADAQKFVTRCRAMAPYIDQHIANLKHGLAAGKSSSVDAVKKTIGEVDALSSASIDGWAMLAGDRGSAQVERGGSRPLPHRSHQGAQGIRAAGDRALRPVPEE